MTKYEELLYLYSPEHKKECCGFANFLAEELSNYMECSRDKIRFKYPSSKSTCPDCNESTIKEVKNGFVCMTIIVKLKDEKRTYPNVIAGIGLQKVNDGFLARIDCVRDTYLLSKEDDTKLTEFCDILFNVFTDRDLAIAREKAWWLRN